MPATSCCAPAQLTQDAGRGAVDRHAHTHPGWQGRLKDLAKSFRRMVPLRKVVTWAGHRLACLCPNSRRAMDRSGRWANQHARGLALWRAPHPVAGTPPRRNSRKRSCANRPAPGCAKPAMTMRLPNGPRKCAATRLWRCASPAVKHIARKRFGQHFLTDMGIIDAIVRAINPQPGQRVVEIGPGLAALTQPSGGAYRPADRG